MLGAAQNTGAPQMNSITLPSALQCFPLPPCPPASSPPIPTPEAACAASWEGAELSPCPARRWWVLSGVHRTHPRVQEARRCSLVAATPVWHGMHKDSLPGAEHNRARLKPQIPSIAPCHLGQAQPHKAWGLWISPPNAGDAHSCLSRGAKLAQVPLDEAPSFARSMRRVACLALRHGSNL